MVCDNQTRSILVTEQRTGGFDSAGEVVTNNDGSVTVTFCLKNQKENQIGYKHYLIRASL